jgi:hypothetical protein
MVNFTGTTHSNDQQLRRSLSFGRTLDYEEPRPTAATSSHHSATRLLPAPAQLHHFKA